MTHDRLIGSLIAVFGLAAGLMTIGWPAGFNSDSVVLTTHFFPRMIAAGIAVCGIWLAVRPEMRTMDFSPVSAVRLAGLAAFLLVVVSVARRDFFLAGFLFGAVSLWISRAGMVRSIIYAAIISAVVFCVFRYAFNMQIPNAAVWLMLNA